MYSIRLKPIGFKSNESLRPNTCFQNGRTGLLRADAVGKRLAVADKPGRRDSLYRLPSEKVIARVCVVSVSVSDGERSTARPTAASRPMRRFFRCFRRREGARHQIGESVSALKNKFFNGDRLHWLYLLTPIVQTIVRQPWRAPDGAAHRVDRVIAHGPARYEQRVHPSTRGNGTVIRPPQTCSLSTGQALWCCGCRSERTWRRSRRAK